MHACVVALRRLHRGRKLYYVDVSRLHLELHKKIQNTVEFLRKDPKDADFRLIDNRLRPFAHRPNVGVNPDAFNSEKLSALMAQIAG